MRNRLEENDPTRPNFSNSSQTSNNKENIITTPVTVVNNVGENRNKFAGRVVTRARTKLKQLLPDTPDNIAKIIKLKKAISSVIKTDDNEMRVFLDSFSIDNGITFQESEEALE